MAQTVLQYGKTSQQRIGPYIVISKRKLPTKAQNTNSSQSTFKHNQYPTKDFLLRTYRRLSLFWVGHGLGIVYG